MRPDMTDSDGNDENAIAPGPLDGTLVIDLTRVLAGPYCTLMLAELGARVIKVERPGYGDDAREVGPFINGKSAYFMSLNRGKQSLVLDLGSADDRPIFEKLLARADVLVENYRPGVLAKHGYGWDRLHARASRGSCSPRSRASARQVPTRAGPHSTWSCRPWAG